MTSDTKCIRSPASKIFQAACYTNSHRNILDAGCNNTCLGADDLALTMSPRQGNAQQLQER